MRPVILMLIYIRVERQGDFALQLYACHKMIPYLLMMPHLPPATLIMLALYYAAYEPCTSLQETFWMLI